MEKITQVVSFNHMSNVNAEVEQDEHIFLRRDGVMIPLGTFAEASKRAIGRSYVLGINRENYGEFGTPAINDNLFVARTNYSQPLSSAVRGKQFTVFGANKIMSYLGQNDNVSNYVFRKPQKDNGARVRKSKRANKRTHKKQRTNRRKRKLYGGSTQLN